MADTTIFTRDDASHRLNEAGAIIKDVMAWDSTPEGHSYWDEVLCHLQDRAIEAERQGFNSKLKIKVTSTDLTKVVLASDVVHIYDRGRTLCGTPKGDPVNWPKGHSRIGIHDDGVTCADCAVKHPKVLAGIDTLKKQIAASMGVMPKASP